MKKEYVVELVFIALFAIMTLASYKIIFLGFDWTYLAYVVVALSFVCSIRKRGIFSKWWIIVLVWLLFILIRHFIPLS